MEGGRDEEVKMRKETMKWPCTPIEGALSSDEATVNE